MELDPQREARELIAMHTTLKSLTLMTAASLALVASGWGARAHADGLPLPPDPAACAPVSLCDEPPDGCPCPTTCISNPLFKIPCFDDCIAAFKKGKEASCFKLGAGAYHWWNIQNDGGDATYGYPGGGEGTYFYYVNADIECPRCNPCAPQWGAHAQLRARDDTVFRSFFDEKVWFYEGYAWLDLPALGRFKAGKIWKRFGLDWDGTFWGNVPYYDGMKLDPDFGASWERTWNPGKRLELNAFAQFFLAEDGVNGSIQGGDAESDSTLKERNTFVARVQPRWRFTKNMSIAVGASGLVGNIEDQVGNNDETLTQFAVDAEFVWCGLKVFAEYAHSDGRQNRAHYVTGGPSDVYETLLAGAQYAIGPFTARAVYSHGDYKNPGGEQDLLLVGGTVALTSWLTLYLEYVDWTVQATGGAEVQFEDGFQIVLNWDV
jgi:hypothetical protein